MVLTEPLYLELSHFLLLPINADGVLRIPPTPCCSSLLPPPSSHICYFLPHWFQAGLKSALKYIFLICCVLYFKRHTLHTLYRDTLEIRNLVANQYHVFTFFNEILSLRIIWYFECVISPKRWRKCCWNWMYSIMPSKDLSSQWELIHMRAWIMIWRVKVTPWKLQKIVRNINCSASDEYNPINCH